MHLSWMHHMMHPVGHHACVENGSIIVDIKTAFLHSDPEEEIYMNLPDGMEGEGDECLLLLKALYGLVQGA